MVVPRHGGIRITISRGAVRARASARRAVEVLHLIIRAGLVGYVSCVMAKGHGAQWDWQMTGAKQLQQVLSGPQVERACQEKVLD